MIELEGVSVTHAGGVRALVEVTARFPRGLTTALVGASGSGKSTLLRLANRLARPERGVVRVDGRDAAEVDPIALRRGIGYAVQGGGLLPHLSSLDNAGLVPLLSGWSAARRRQAAEAALRLVRLDPAEHGSRPPAALSGGQRQRVSIARALAADPAVLLLDEPFGALDPHLRETLQDEFRELFTRLKKTVLFVTHDLHEAVRVADRVAVLDRGRLVQFGTPREVVFAPASPEVEVLLGRRRRELEAAVQEAGGC